jgi:ABC-type amino acid transport substrate-binding protein
LAARCRNLVAPGAAARESHDPCIPSVSRPVYFWPSCLPLLATLVGFANAQTPTRLDAIVGAGALRVGLTEDYRRFLFADASGKVEGIDVDMAMSLAQSLGVRLGIVKTSWPTLKSDLEANSFDIAMGRITITSTARKLDCSPAPSFQAARRRSRTAETNRNTEGSRRSISPAST